MLQCQKRTLSFKNRNIGANYSTFYNVRIFFFEFSSNDDLVFSLETFDIYLITAVSLGVELYNLIQFNKDCWEKYSKATRGYQTLKETKKNLTIILDDIYRLGEKVDEVFYYLWGSLRKFDIFWQHSIAVCKESSTSARVILSIILPLK